MVMRLGPSRRSVLNPRATFRSSFVRSGTSSVKKLNLIGLSLVAAIPAGFLVYLLVMALTLKQIWNKQLLGVMVVVTAVIALVVALWPPIYAIAFYTEKSNEDDEEKAEGEAALAADDAEVADADEAEEFPQQDLEAFDGEAAEVEAEEVGTEEVDHEDFHAAETGSEFDLDEEIEQVETTDFELDAAEAEELEELEEEDEEKPPQKNKKKKKK
jgi:hypothetical protein